ncbi:inositol monophosphatase family protein [Aeromicrobium phragmitis]|nr:inositol monophosphatase family protein [Aeromicrobium phragmitis]
MSEPGLDLDAVHATALDLARGAGELARRFAAEGYGSVGDIDRRMVHHLVARYREHGILSRESGRHGPDDARVQWLIDPLNGTDNYRIGLDLYGVTVAVLLDDRPLVAIVHDSASGRSTSAIAERGAWQEGRRLSIAAPRPATDLTVAWIEGGEVAVDDPTRQAALHMLERSTHRVLRTGAPARDWALLAEGGIEAVVIYRGEPWDLTPGRLIAREAGAAEVHHREFTIVGEPSAVEELATAL